MFVLCLFDVLMIDDCYVLFVKVGCGVMGEVYKVCDVCIDVIVVVKFVDLEDVEDDVVDI